jgi:phage replication-related protein YjqB (UPF0714/DUF867 family)
MYWSYGSVVYDDTFTGDNEKRHFIEFLYDDGSNVDVVICAAHGGRIEPGTAKQAIKLASQLSNATCWACLGYDEEGNEFEQWHPASTAISPADYPLLDKIAHRGFDTVISLHGLVDDRLLVGGGVDTEVKHYVRDHLTESITTPVETVSEGPYAGVSPDNFVNWLAKDGGGLQLEQGPSIRDEDADTVIAALKTLVAADRL